MAAPLTSLDEGRLFGRRLGPGPPRVVALHGWGRDSSDFVEALSGLPALAVDLPGFGASPAPGEPIGAAGYLEHLDPVFDHLRQPVVLVGHSFGGRVALAAAVARADQVGGLVLIGVPLLRAGTRSRTRPGYRAIRLAHRFGLVSDAQLEQARRRYGSPDYRAAQGVMRQVLVRAVNETYEHELSRLAVPTRLVWGTDDREVPVTVARRAMGLIPDGLAELVEVPGGGHHLPTTHPGVVREVVTRMMEG